jgi:cyclase
MLKKRLIFTLLYNRGAFVLSRNFRLQRVGDVAWLKKNYNFSRIAESIDELVILNVTRGEPDTARFCEAVMELTQGCFMPCALGGGLRTLDQARSLMDAGADKLIVNTALVRSPGFVQELVHIYGSQCVIASIDYRNSEGGFPVFIDNGSAPANTSLRGAVEGALRLGTGEIYLNSMDRDGTGQGYCMEVLAQVEGTVGVPLIMAGGAGNHRHLQEALAHPLVDAAATANLFNFVGDGLPKARGALIEANVRLAVW